MCCQCSAPLLAGTPSTKPGRPFRPVSCCGPSRGSRSRRIPRHRYDLLRRPLFSSCDSSSEPVSAAAQVASAQDVFSSFSPSGRAHAQRNMQRNSELTKSSFNRFNVPDGNSALTRLTAHYLWRIYNRVVSKTPKQAQACFLSAKNSTGLCLWNIVSKVTCSNP